MRRSIGYRQVSTVQAYVFDVEVQDHDEGSSCTLALTTCMLRRFKVCSIAFMTSMKPEIPQLVGGVNLCLETVA